MVCLTGRTSFREAWSQSCTGHCNNATRQCDFSVCCPCSEGDRGCGTPTSCCARRYVRGALAHCRQLVFFESSVRSRHLEGCMKGCKCSRSQGLARAEVHEIERSIVPALRRSLCCQPGQAAAAHASACSIACHMLRVMPWRQWHCPALAVASTWGTGAPCIVTSKQAPVTISGRWWPSSTSPQCRVHLQCRVYPEYRAGLPCRHTSPLGRQWAVGHHSHPDGPDCGRGLRVLLVLPELHQAQALPAGSW